MFIWDQANTDHIATHNVSPAEFEQVVRNRPIELFEERRNGERRINMLGVTDENRFLVVVVSPQGDDVRPVTAFAAKARLRKFYRNARRE